MPAPPSKNAISGSGSTPSNAQARAGFGAMWDNLYGTGGLLGATGAAADARVALGIGPVISFRNLVVNGNFSVNQRVYASGTNTTAANQVTLDRWRVAVSGQNVTFGAAAPDRVVTCPAGGYDQIIEAGWIAGGVYTLSWAGTSTATVNGVAIANGAQTAALPANTAVTLRFASGTLDKVQFEPGTVATPFERRPPQVELALCQRHAAKSYAIGTTPQTAALPGRYWFSGNVGGSINGRVEFPVPMAAAPAVTLYDQTANVNSTLGFAAGGTFTARTATASNITDRGFEVNAGASTDVAITGHYFAATGF